MVMQSDPSTDPPRYFENPTIPANTPDYMLEGHISLYDILLYIFTEYREEIRQVRESKK
jgi:hypothetical protein